ncbi:MAG: haloacid dehalogenase type II [Paracoccaceae bacterium]|nr:haloacid dehalogenase type II [Paracoccaceae bacterium]
MPIKVCAFDAYGTLFDLSSAARIALEDHDKKSGMNISQTVAENWRLKQLQYTWIRAITGEHTDFWNVTCESLDWALEKSNLHNDGQLRSRLLELYKELEVYPEVPEILAKLKELPLPAVILSNGSPAMLQSAIDASGIGDYLEMQLSVEEVGIFKPASRVYELVLKHYNCQAEEVLFVSSNGWDAAAAKGFGFLSAWANRLNDPVDRFPWTPDFILSSLVKIPSLAKKL